MELTTALAFGALPVILLGASASLAHAYNKLQARHARITRDRDSYLEVLEGSNDALFVINFVNGRIYQANEQAARMLGYGREELAASTIFQLHPTEFLQRSAERIADAWEQKGAIYEDIPLLTRNGELIQVESSVRVTTYQGRPAIILFARDIRERLALREGLQQQQALVQRQNAELLDSIRYAKRIQDAVMPDAAALVDLVPDAFILYRPKDIVSGDLYWFAEKNGRTVVAAADCTGHGVPGALLSLIGVSLFRETVLERGVVLPEGILEALRDGVIDALNGQGDEEEGHRDGMNVSVVSIDRQAMQLDYAGAYAPIFIVRNGELIELKGDRIPVGYHDGELRAFTGTSMPLQKGDRIYLFSDGMQDQFGGPQGKKLRSAGLKEWVLSTTELSMDDQCQTISDRFRLWKGREEQIDDVLLIGLEV